MTISKSNYPKTAPAFIALAIFLTACFAAPNRAAAADNMGLMYQQEFNRYIAYGDFTNSPLLHSEVEVLYYDRVIAVGYVKELHPSYIVVQVLKFAINVFLRDATSIRPYMPEKLDTLKKIVTNETPYDYDPYRMTIYPYVSSPDAKVKKSSQETYKGPVKKEAAADKTAEPKIESRRHEKASAEKSGEKEKLDSGPALKEKSDTNVKESETGSRRRRRAETTDEKK